MEIWLFSVVTWPATKGKGRRAYATELGPTIKAFGPREIGVPATVTGGAPGKNCTGKRKSISSGRPSYLTINSGGLTCV